MTIFMDASAVVSLYSLTDPNHRPAKNIIYKLASDQLITSNFVFAEIITILSQKVSKEKSTFAGNYIRKNFKIIRLTAEIEELAWEIFKKQTSKNVSFVDCTTFALYQQGLFDKAFTFDSDFATNKVPVLN
ncbi:MAG: hypothetical protein ACD_38C00197G0003 [uncultured bacterium]|uniref:PIN domain-containing protein n=1 Tax=Candidatus Daviesbacteria bacterium GW2011_GWC2_40_12 TaxID=1618431 RepID=A0A0G0TTQ3_9BACT|nr:MAG: hypothetical protein ACD_38C00197G0003 [uncultured bacterium]KKQ82560.1 MAG: hypothetical protein UT04_C0057G0008 [Candidatus Daviesbacteria bacterium GW2011_GWF2_38_7]KKR15585.1 MAG: hypothetical protein UT45_C0018G0025 [Candidatus Daviesbacteria bacterium GW2011_GWA2_39_33]KKR22945.1 MAG: hypothetical protein UT54_C0059G0010 [Candidatus Daviesbacteria bacterium GW2011_GWB1_39_5]KKR41267.1 MAG: hypothetical protein UT77_C0015G0009 [Candidatus Daviesbacteria bacterium GW2011_GWC2_40_12]